MLRFMESQRVGHDCVTELRLKCIAQELFSMTCGDLHGKEIQNREDICIPVADSLHCAAATYTTLQSSSSSVKTNLKRQAQ